MIEFVATMMASYLPLLATFMFIVIAGLFYLAMRRYHKLHAMLQAPGFRIEIDGESEQASKNPDSNPTERRGG